MTIPFTYSQFIKENDLSIDKLGENIYLNNSDKIKIKNFDIGVKNIVIILKAVIKLSSSKGYHATSLRDLSSETGLSMGGLYSYFNSKDELLYMIYEQGFRMIIDIINRQIVTLNKPHKKLLNIICSHLYLSEFLQKFFYFFFMETKNLAIRDQKKAVQMELKTENIIVEVLKEGNNCGDYNCK